MFNFLKRLFSRTATAPAQAQADSDQPWTLRRWEAAETNRLNRTHWRHATGAPINEDLSGDLRTLRARCRYEAFNNPLVEGVIATHQTDVVGVSGPALQVRSDNEAYNEAAEAVWQAWWQCPDAGGQMAGADILKLAIRGLWTDGEFLHQLVTDDTADGPVQLRLLAIEPDRLDTPMQLAGQANCVLGVERNKNGKPTRYHLAEYEQVAGFEVITGKSMPLPPDLIIHEYLHLEAGQARGVPWLASALPTIAELRDFDAQVLDAARAAADMAVVLWTNHTDARYVEVDETVDIERRTISTMPPGWQPFQLQPGQPASTYVEFRRERMAEIGRGVSMPLMAIRLDSSEHNYSSARFDGQVYQRGLASIQGWLTRRVLERLVKEVLREATLAARAGLYGVDRVLANPPAKIKHDWTGWPRPPHVDPAKEANAEATRLANGTLTYAEALAAHGSDEDQVIASRKRTNEKLEAAGLPPLPIPQTAVPQQQAQSDSDAEGDDEKPRKKTAQAPAAKRTPAKAS